MGAGIFSQSLRLLGLSLAGVYFILPVVVRLIPGLAKQLIFLAFVSRPFIKYDNPQLHFNITASRNFYLVHEEHVKLGIWQLLPRSSGRKWMTSDSDTDWELALSQIEKPIFLYLHGNAFNRAAHHRMELYGLLADLDYHVIAFDYRGYGDSLGTPSSGGLVADSRFLFDWVRERSGDNPIYIWGHSLGTAVATELAAQLSESGHLEPHSPAGVVLEAPFNNLDDVIEHHPLTLPIRWLPWFKWLVENPIRNEPIKFNSDQRIVSVKRPVLILHAHDDHVVPFALGQQLYAHAREHGVDAHWHEFESHHQYEHKYICRAPELPALLNTFIQWCLQSSF